MYKIHHIAVVTDKKLKTMDLVISKEDLENYCIKKEQRASKTYYKISNIYKYIQVYLVNEATFHRNKSDYLIIHED
jgi:hypothetical protein